VANFKVSLHGDNIDHFDIPVNREIKLLQWGGDRSGNRLNVALEPHASPTIRLDVLDEPLPAASTSFTVIGSAPGVTAKVMASASGPQDPYCGDLYVNVKDEAKKHPGYEVDLISNLAIKGDAQDLYNYSRMMIDPEPILQQNIVGRLNCGTVSENYGPKFFHTKASLAYNAYYLPPTSSRMDELRFDPNRMRSSFDRIQKLLRQGTPVRVWLVHADGFNKTITLSDPTHFVLIVGYGGNQFLYIDPWPDGSKFPYNGNMYPPKTTLHTFFGQLEFDPTHLELGIRHSPISKGSMPYTVIAGP